MQPSSYDRESSSLSDDSQPQPTSKDEHGIGSQQALELRKYFAPYDPKVADKTSGFNAELNSDGALDSYTENVLWRLDGARAMICLVDAGTQYFLAGTRRQVDDDGTVSVEYDGKWFGRESIPTLDGLCENIMVTENKQDGESCFCINDLQAVPKFARQPMVDGTLESYRFYAGTPITTANQINIGVLFMFDHEPRAKGLNKQQQKFLRDSAGYIMRHLETAREAIERRRVTLMSKGIATFLEKTAQVTTNGNDAEDDDEGNAVDDDQTHLEASAEETEHDQNDNSVSQAATSTLTLDKIKLTLNHAASILWDSLELKVGGVIFLDTSIGYNKAGITDAFLDKSSDLGAEVQNAISNPSEAATPIPLNPLESAVKVNRESNRQRTISGNVRSSADQYRPAKVLAKATEKASEAATTKVSLDAKTLQTFINIYPKGNVWYIDDKGHFASLEQVHAVKDDYGNPKAGASMTDVQRQQGEVGLLSKVFKHARQVIFIPLWDAANDRWHSGCFVWSRSAVPVFTVDSEIAYLSAFTNSVMVEISRLDAITADKIKSNFISSISHEFRSPLHGILASTEFLRESKLDDTQVEYASTIQSCGSTLLDTINHVLDYSKINSFEQTGDKAGKVPNELVKRCNLVLLCEDIVNGMAAASGFTSVTDAMVPIGAVEKPASVKHSFEFQRPVEIILDFEKRSWEFDIQPGAVRRILMNIFGNSCKYTTEGFILLRLRVKAAHDETQHQGSMAQVLTINVIDTGRGISPEYMERKLYTPFAQEDSFATGIGLGLSIVHSIVGQLRGTINIESEVDKGTHVEVVLPLIADKSEYMRCDQAAFPGKESLQHDVDDGQETLKAVKSAAQDRTILLWRKLNESKEEAENVRLFWDCLSNYISSWFGFKVVEDVSEDSIATADLIIIEQQDVPPDLERFPSMNNATRILLICDQFYKQDAQSFGAKASPVSTVWNPVGPYKLARAILSAFRKPDSTVAQAAQDVGSSHPKTAGSEEGDVTRSISQVNREIANSEEGLSSKSFQSNPSSVRVAVSSASQNQVDEPPMNKVRNAMNALSLADSSTSLDQPELEVSHAPVIDKKSASPPRQASQIAMDVAGSHTTKAVVTDIGGLHLLAVDDNALNLQLLHRFLLKRKTDTIILARNGVEAVDAVRNADRPFDIIFMDISMPEMDGFEATRQIRKYELGLSETCETEDTIGIEDKSRPDLSWRRANVVALTGLASRKDRDEAERSGFDDFLTKPINFRKITELLKSTTEAKHTEP